MISQSKQWGSQWSSSAGQFDETHREAVSPLLWPERYSEENRDALYAFLTECCWTYNEADRTVELIPQASYIYGVCWARMRARKESDTLIIEKSRRMLVSWILRACELWSLGLRKEKGLVCGLDYDKAAEHVWRIWWLHDQMRLRRPDLNLESATPRSGNPAAQVLNEVILPNGSLVTTLNQDGLAFQGSGFSWVTMEEFSRYKDVDFMYGQAIRVVEGKAAKAGEKDKEPRGGNVVIVTNAGSNQAWKKIKQPHQDPVPINVTDTPKGMTIQKIQDKTWYCRLHYTADPAKTPEWAAVERARVPSREWLREMEMQEHVFEGEPVYADYNDSRHAVHVSPKLSRFSTFIGGWDCGNTLNPAFVLLQVTQTDRQAQAILEVLAPGPEPMDKFCPRVTRALERLMPGAWFIIEHWGDATVSIRNGANGETAKQAAARYDINIRPASNEWEGRYGSVTWLLSDTIEEGKPRFILDATRCPLLREGFLGAYRFDLPHRDGAVGPDRVYPERPRKDGYSHVQDARQYAASRARKLYNSGRLA